MSDTLATIPNAYSAIIDFCDDQINLPAIIEQALRGANIQHGSLPPSTEEAQEALEYHRRFLATSIIEVERLFIQQKQISVVRFNALIKNIAMHVKSIEKLVTYLTNQQADVQLRDSETSPIDLIMHIYSEVATAKQGLFIDQPACFNCTTKLPIKQIYLDSTIKHDHLLLHTCKAEERNFFGGHNCPSPKDLIIPPSHSYCLACATCGEPNCVYSCTKEESYEAIRKKYLTSVFVLDIYKVREIVKPKKLQLRKQS